MVRPADRTGTGDRGASIDSDTRRAHGYSLAGITSLSAGVSPAIRSEWGLADRDQALLELAAAIDEDRLGVPRLLVLDALVKLAARQPDDVYLEDSALDAVISALVRTAAVSAGDQDRAAATVRRALEEVARVTVAEPGVRSWAVFAGEAAGALRLTKAEIEKPTCNDREVETKGEKAIGVSVDFVTDAAPGEMSVCDPTRWHECTASFHPMRPWQDSAAIDEKRPNGWRRDLIETVDFLPGLTLETPLRFTYSIDAGVDPAWVHLDYVLLAETSDIAVDEGSIDLRRIAGGAGAGRTRVTTRKLIGFKNPMLASWPTVACDTFWTDLVVNAAVGCLGGDTHSHTLSNGGKAPVPDSTQPDMSKAIDAAAKAAQESIAAYAELAKQAAGQLTGNAAADNAAWVQLSSQAYGRATADAAKAWTLYSEILRAAAEGGSEAAPAPGGPVPPAPNP